ncbi:hypothetical protein ZWY2020_044572 [Hordeum vulgare]|nr:hypothetical protein ZWY2020_044572 [Hordeum vulgare]
MGDDGRAKLADFGCLRKAGAASDVPIIGSTPAFMAPEVARGEDQGPAADVWALGCTVVEMATGHAPWSGMDGDALAALHRIGYTQAVPEVTESAQALEAARGRGRGGGRGAVSEEAGRGGGGGAASAAQEEAGRGGGRVRAPAEEEVLPRLVVGAKRKAPHDVEVVASGGEEDEVFDDEGRLLRTVFIENLPLRTKKKALTKEFTTFGVVDSVRIRSVPLGDCTMEALQGGTMEGFFNLISYFQTQSEPAFCSLASLSVVLNVLAIDPGRLWKGPWRWFVTCIMFGCGRSALAD